MTNENEVYTENYRGLTIHICSDDHSKNVYGFIIENDEGEDLDACWGFSGKYPEKGNCIEQARKAAENIMNSEAENAALDLAITQARIRQYQSELGNSKAGTIQTNTQPTQRKE